MKLTRRSFLQQTGLALTALGLSEAGLFWLSDRYRQVLAQPTRRKLALLIGINQYPEQVCDCAPIRGTALTGCLTDVELQRELLIYRFGFQPSDIVMLTDQSATHQGIAEAFLEHLTRQARPGDVVVFHFSGLGSRVRVEASGSDQPLEQNSLVPIDGLLPTVDSPVLNDLLEDTLGLLVRSLPTDQVTTVLDLGYTNLGRVMQGNLRIRSRPNAPTGQLSDAERALQEQLTAQTGISTAQVRSQWQSGQLPGVVLTATQGNQIAAEGQWNGFSAGLFTQALTQQLWWTTPATTLRMSFSQAIGSVKQTAGVEQQPSLSGQTLQKQILPAHYLGTDSLSGAEGVIRAIEDDGRVQLWLAGLPASVSENYGISLLSVVDSASGTQPAALLQIRSRDGLTFRARPYRTDGAPAPQVGQLVQESVRVLPRNVGLTVALDPSLERIERVDATSAFAVIPRVSAVPAGEQPADFLFGKTQPVASAIATSLISTGEADDSSDRETPIAAAALKSGYGLFSLGRDAIPNTLVPADEAVKTAVHRLTPQLRTLLATKLLRLTENRGSSGLGVRATLEMVAPQERIIMQQETARAAWTAPASKLTALFVGSNGNTLPMSSRIQYRLLNYSDRPVYFILLGLDTNGNAVALFPSVTGDRSTPLADDSLIPPGEVLTIPKTTSASDWVLQMPPGLAETHIVFSRSPFTQSYQVLQTEMRSKADARHVTLVVNPLEVVQAVLQDLHQASTAPDLAADSYTLDVNTWATLSFVYQVVAG